MNMLSQSLISRLRNIATWYDLAAHEPVSAAVVASYDQLKSELWGQWMSRKLDITFTTDDPYLTSSAMFADCTLRQLRIYTVADLPINHPLAAMTPAGVAWNSIFRAVHDGLIHWPGRYRFSLQGELQAFRAHHAQLSPLAGHAIATETLAQVAWYHYGPGSHRIPRPYAPQKACLFPLSLIQEVLTDESI